MTEKTVEEYLNKKTTKEEYDKIADELVEVLINKFKEDDFEFIDNAQHDKEDTIRMQQPDSSGEHYYIGDYLNFTITPNDTTVGAKEIMQKLVSNKIMYNSTGFVTVFFDKLKKKFPFGKVTLIRTRDNGGSNLFLPSSGESKILLRLNVLTNTEMAHLEAIEEKKANTPADE